MMLVNASLLRERFTIRYKNNTTDPAIALGNRILLPLVSESGTVKERLIVRAHSMHTALRMAAVICQEFYGRGPLLNRHQAFNWQKAWNNIIEDFERIYAPQTWVCIYNNGRPVFSDGEYHPFLDVIEQCDIKNRAEYDRAVNIAEDVFMKAGKDVSIEHEATIGLVVGAFQENARCGLILRAPRRTTTFNFKIEGKNEQGAEKHAPHHGLLLAADHLEAIQLAVTTGFIQSQQDQGLIRSTSAVAKKAAASHRRIGRLNQSVQFIESQFQVRYRPEKPNFLEILEDAREMQKETRI